MKFLKAIFGNALVLATAVTILAGAVLVNYADPSAPAAGHASREASRGQ